MSVICHFGSVGLLVNYFFSVHFVCQLSFCQLYVG